MQKIETAIKKIEAILLEDINNKNTKRPLEGVGGHYESNYRL